MDCSLDNLEWVPFDDQRYKDYMAIRTQELKAKDEANMEKALKEKEYYRKLYHRNDTTSTDRADIPE